MNAALASFARKAPAQSVLITYFCGYLAVFNDRGFLVPVSAELAAPDRIMTEGIAAKALINVMIRADPRQGLAILDVAPAPSKSDPVIETTFAVANPSPAAAMLAISQPVPGAPGNVLAERLRAASVNLRTLLESARADWGGQPGTTVALTAMPSEDVYLRGEPPPQPAPTPAPATASTDPGSVETSDVESQMSRPERRRVQARLRALGYYEGNDDGVFGTLTRDAIRRYQSANGLPQTGRLGVTEATQLLFLDARQARP
jgi:Putative peptidoglycan binding domain